MRNTAVFRREAGVFLGAFPEVVASGGYLVLLASSSTSVSKP
jgi:hypothetical protein